MSAPTVESRLSDVEEAVLRLLAHVMGTAARTPGRAAEESHTALVARLRAKHEGEK